MKQATIAEFSAKDEQKKKTDEEKTTSQDSLTKKIKYQEEQALGEKEGSNESFTNRLVHLTDEPEEILMKVRTAFPLDAFPDTIIIDPLKIQIIQKYFFLSQTVKSIYIKDIIDATIETSPWTSTLEIVTKEDDHPIRISYIRTKDAEKAMKLIKGLVLSLKEG